MIQHVFGLNYDYCRKIGGTFNYVTPHSYEDVTLMQTLGKEVADAFRHRTVERTYLLILSG